MPAVIDATVGGATSNSYGTEAEATQYFDERIPLNPPWSSAPDAPAVLIMATRILDAYFQPLKVLVKCSDGCDSYYKIRRHWTGAPATSTQRLAWPRIGMYDRNGNAIASNIIPQELKDAQFELAGRLLNSDLTLQNEIALQGITSAKVGSLAVTFKDSIAAQVVPDAIYDLLIASWLTDELIEPVNSMIFEVV